MPPGSPSPFVLPSLHRSSRPNRLASLGLTGQQREMGVGWGAVLTEHQPLPLGEPASSRWNSSSAPIRSPHFQSAVSAVETTGRVRAGNGRWWAQPSLHQPSPRLTGFGYRWRVKVCVVWCKQRLSLNFTDMPPSSPPAHFMSEHDGAGTCEYLLKWQNVTKNHLKVQRPPWGTFPLGVRAFRSASASTGSPSKTHWDTCVNCCVKQQL